MAETGEPIKPNEIPFSKESSVILLWAREEARDRNSSQVTPEHLLLGLTKNPIIEGALSRIFVTPDEIRLAVNFHLGTLVGKKNYLSRTNVNADESLPYSFSSKNIISFARDEAYKDNRKEITPLDLVVAILREPNKIMAASILKGIGFENIKMVKRIYENVEKEYKEK